MVLIVALSFTPFFGAMLIIFNANKVQNEKITMTNALRHQHKHCVLPGPEWRLSLSSPTGFSRLVGVTVEQKLRTLSRLFLNFTIRVVENSGLELLNN